MDRTELESLTQQLLAGEISQQSFLAAAAKLAEKTAAVGPLRLDLDRARRCGFPEVIYGPGKDLDALVALVRRLLDSRQPALATRLTDEQQTRLACEFPQGIAHRVARTFRVAVEEEEEEEEPLGCVAVITAGAADAPVAEEACETLRWMNIREVVLVADVGVAGPHRLPERLPEFIHADVVVVAAGMEGALPSVVAGYLPCPVIGVPTSVGYGASFSGVSALLSMLNSCAANVSVVNIDAGFRGGFIAGLISKNKWTANSQPLE